MGCEFVDNAEMVLECLIEDGKLVEEGPQRALTGLCDLAQKSWLESHKDFCDDITGLLLYWRSPKESRESETHTHVDVPPQVDVSHSSVTTLTAKPVPPQMDVAHSSVTTLTSSPKCD